MWIGALGDHALGRARLVGRDLPGTLEKVLGVDYNFKDNWGVGRGRFELYTLVTLAVIVGFAIVGYLAGRACGAKSFSWKGMCRSRGTRSIRVVRVWRIPYSTNCERVALARAGWGSPSTGSRSMSTTDAGAGPERPGRVPIAEIDGEIVVGSLAITRWIAPGLWPSAPRARAQVDVFLDWFERVWLHPLGILWHGDDDDRRKRAGARLARSLDRFEDLLDGSDHLFGADRRRHRCDPFIKYATDDTWTTTTRSTS